jgi:hypothetical protein
MASPAKEKPAMTPAEEARFIELWQQGPYRGLDDDPEEKGRHA